jgi:indolepyruvate ferredoxin oxidoreductase
MNDMSGPPLADVTLADRYDLSKSTTLLNGAQAVARLLLMQKERDRRAGLNTGGFVTGYRGSPVGGLDLQFARLKKEFAAADIHFEPGLNEELAATALWGTQQAEMRGEGRFDGVFGLWYGKGPGVDRSGDVLRHANLAGTSKHGGVLALMGDDHTAESSTTAHQSEFAFVDVMMPILSPAGVQEVLDYGALGYALSRFAGVWVGIKCIKDTIESTAVVDARIDRVNPVIPADYKLPPGGLNIRTPDPILEQEARLQDHKREAMVAWLAANKINRTILSGGAAPRIGIITAGKSYLDVRQALGDLGLDEARCEALGLRLFKLGCTWPVVPAEIHAFAQGLDLIIVVEEKRSLIEVQVREELYGSASQPVCVGKRDEKGEWLFPVKASLDPNQIGLAIGERLLRYHDDESVRLLVNRLRQARAAIADIKQEATRTPYFCSGCPHNRSTVIPDDARAYAGIGCHFMAQFMDRNTDGYTQMGGEGANWVGEARFSKRGHVFQNLGDGTYNHSGALALRWAIDTKTNVTYKILFNDAVAMTGGQRHEGGLTVPQIARQVAADGANRVVVVTDEPNKYSASEHWPAGMKIYPREDLIAVEEELSKVPGTTVLIYDQTCAAEKRRRRKRGEFPDPDKRAFINELVCEGCGDCGVKSNCVSIQPKDTEFGRKRAIDQSSCNKDFSCTDGFCPSFVTVEGAKVRKSRKAAAAPPPVAEPARPELTETPYSIVVTGVGGTGVVTIAAILGMAAHLEGRGCGMIDMAGLAQKGGAVYSHVKLARAPEDIHAIRVAPGGADLILGCDLVVSGSRAVLSTVNGPKTGVVVNAAEVFPGDFTRNPDFSLPTERLKRAIQSAAGGEAKFVDATAAAVAALGNSIGANMFVLGYAYQAGLVPLSSEAIRRAIGLNGEAVEMNLSAFAWGRAAFADPSAIASFAKAPAADKPEDLASVVAKRVDFLVAYQNRAYAERYKALVDEVAKAEQAKAPGRTGLALAVARYAFKLMAYKDEYEVARLYSDGSFSKSLSEAFEGDLKITYHLAPPILGRKDPRTGLPRKTAFGPWMMRAFSLLAAFKGLRGGALDVFGYTEERRAERRLVEDYFALAREVIGKLDASNHALAVTLASLPEKARGYGYVKAKSLAAVKEEWAKGLESWRSGAPLARAAE